jgi:hypothetical protein
VPLVTALPGATFLSATEPVPLTVTVSPPISALTVPTFDAAAVALPSYTRVPLMFVFSGVIAAAPGAWIVRL